MANFSSTYPATKPVFMADFANGGKIDPRATFSRPDSPINGSNAPASAVHYWSNEKHLSSENLVAQSSDLGSWSKGAVDYLSLTSNATTAPDGTTTAAQLTGLTGTNKKAIYYPVTAGSGSHTGIFYVKPNGHEYVQIMFGGVSTVYQNYHLSSTGTLGNGNNDGASITQMGDWYKITLTSSSLSSATNYYLVLVDNNTASRYQDSTSTSSVYAWGANLSSTGEKVFNATTTQIHREYAPTLKSVATAGAARFEYDPTDGQSMGLLVESSRTNLITYSNNFGAWGASQVTAEAGAAVGPDGQLCYVMREDTSAADTHYLNLGASGQSTSTTYTMSVYAKKVASSNQTRHLRLRVNGLGGEASVEYNLTNGTVNRAYGIYLDSSSISSIGNGWYRLVMTYTNPSGSTANGMIITGSPDSSSTLPSYDGDGYTSFALFGAQVEAGSHASSLITSNSGSQTTRALDSLSVVDSSLFDNGSGALAAEYDMFAASETSYLLHIEKSSGGTNGGGISVTNRYLGVESNYLDLGNTTSNVFHKVAASWETGSQKMSRDGGAASEDTSTVLPSGTDKLFIGVRQDGGEHVNGHIKRLAIYSEPLSSTNLQALTS